jgi:hypothetical protein
MARNEDNDLDDDDDQHVHREQPSSPPQMPLPSSTWLITLNQQGSLGDGVPTHYEVH